MKGVRIILLWWTISDSNFSAIKMNSLEILSIILRKMKMVENLLTRNGFFDILNLRGEK